MPQCAHCRVLIEGDISICDKEVPLDVIEVHRDRPLDDVIDLSDFDEGPVDEHLIGSPIIIIDDEIRPSVAGM